jgi:hypothetical protein
MRRYVGGNFGHLTTGPHDQHNLPVYLEHRDVDKPA